MIDALRANTGFSELTADNRTGRIARSLEDGKLCRYILFDNKTAQAVEDPFPPVTRACAKPKGRPVDFQLGSVSPDAG